MKIAGFLLLLAGWTIVVSAIVLLAAPLPRACFTVAGAVIEVLGLALVFRSHLLENAQ